MTPSTCSHVARKRTPGKCRGRAGPSLIEIRGEVRPPTKRHILLALLSVGDPLGGVQTGSKESVMWLCEG